MVGSVATIPAMKIWSTQEDSIRSIKGTAGALVIRHKSMPIVGIISHPRTAGGRFTYALFRGKAAKPAAYFSARDFDTARAGLAFYWRRAEETENHRATRAKEKAARRATLKASDHFTVGDVLTNSWGYDQTNIDFYQVTHVGARSIKIRAIAQKGRETGFMQGICQPDRFNFTGPEQLKPLDERGTISFRHGGYSKWDGKPEHWTAYA